ncbi:MAG: alanine racemase [Oscillospiraceae bacterium]|nr:alanine racemase [Oscillospiraceae bacterium]
MSFTDISEHERNNRRAWVEIDLDALAKNAELVRSRLPRGCELMAVVKADAYGHGAEPVAARLQDEGVSTFAVATVDEGLSLRKSGIIGEIFVLGYTHPGSAALLKEHDFVQLIFDGAHAAALDAAGYAIRVHISIDTGMHREGIGAANISEIESVFKCANLSVEGVGTHLASADSLAADDVMFTNGQVERFYETVDVLKGRGYDVGKLHIQASYGMLNHPGIECDYIRSGIGLYGVKSHDGDVAVRLPLVPVLSLRAIVAQVREIGSGESVSYGRIFTASRPTRLATICIGYADGVPRHMSGNGGEVIIRGVRAPIVGRVCMDMLMADVTDIGLVATGDVSGAGAGADVGGDDAGAVGGTSLVAGDFAGVGLVAAGDVATLIGRDGNDVIRCEDFARASGTISNEILCRLGSRLPRIFCSKQ